MNLTDAQIRTAEDHVAYENNVTLIGWAETSANGFKVQLELTDRGQLDYFDGVMRRRKAKGGQRYQTIVQCVSTGNLVQQETQFVGRGWSESKGAHLALHVGDPRDQRFWRELVAKDAIVSDEQHPAQLYLILMELGDNEQIVNQKKLALTEGIQDPTLHGGPKSKRVAMTLQDEDFILWLTKRSLYKNRRDLRLDTFEGRDALVKSVCNIDSKRLFDHDDRAWELWEQQFNRPFLHWLQRR